MYFTSNQVHKFREQNFRLVGLLSLFFCLLQGFSLMKRIIIWIFLCFTSKNYFYQLCFYFRYYTDPLPTRYTSDYIHKVLSPVSEKSSYTTYYSEPVRKYIGKFRF